MKWQLIDTAPKDGTEVVLFIPDAHRKVCIGHFVDTETFDYGKSTRKMQFWSTGNMMGMIINGNPSPTHWAPLPDGPDGKHWEFLPDGPGTETE